MLDSSTLSDQEHDAVNRAAEFADRVIGPNAEAWNKLGRVPADVYVEAGELGLCSLIVPQSAGGLGLGVSAMASVMNVFARHCFATAFSFVVHNNLAARVAKSASPRIREQLLPPLMAGQRIGAFLLTEPGTGSDAGAIQTRAERSDGGWLINGSKAWVSNGAIANTLNVYAQTHASLGSKGIACFAVDAESEGVERQEAYELLGGHALATAGFEFKNCWVAGAAMLVPPGEGFRAAMEGIDLARINVAAMCCAMVEVSLQTALAYASCRRAFEHLISDFQGIQWMLADTATDLAATERLTEHAARLSDLGKPACVEAAHAKKFATRAAFTRISDCMQVMGARGYSREHALPRHLEAAKMAHYLDGTTEIQNVVISRALFQKYRA